MAKRKKPRLPDGVFLKDIDKVFSQAAVDIAIGKRFEKRFGRAEIEDIVARCIDEFAATLEELSAYVEDEDWDRLVTLAQETQTRRDIRQSLLLRL